MTVAADYEVGALYDEAFERDGSPRPEYEGVLAAVADAGPERLAALAGRCISKRGVTFGTDQPFLADPVPRLIARDEWNLVEAALEQRLTALNAFLADVYGERRIVAAGVIPADVIASAEHYEPAMAGLELAVPHAPVVGYDLVRGADGRLQVLEDNVRTPSGIAYALELRRIMRMVLPGFAGLAPRELDGCFDALRAILATAAAHHGRGLTVVLTDGRVNSAWFEHRMLARRLGAAMASPERLRVHDGRLCAVAPSGVLKEISVLYRRTDEDRLRRPDGTPTWLADLVLEPLRNGRLTVVNAPGAGVADDKLVHAYVEEMIRFYTGEEPLIESVRTYDLTRPHDLTRALGLLPNLVVKPRTGHGGNGVFIGRECGRAERERVAAELKAAPHRFVAQETVLLSRHPTVGGGGPALEPRHVDLRVFAYHGPDGPRVVPAALTRVAAGRDSLIVNSSQGGGAKDTWIV